MIFKETALPGAFVIELEPFTDERGFFARSWDVELAAEHGLAQRWLQSNVSFNRRAGTMRGMHWQAEPHAEDKLVRVTAGAVWDVLVDLRPDSPSYREHVGVRLDADNRISVYIPKGFAHGFQTLVDETELFYLHSEPHAPGFERGAHWDDPAFGIEWPLPESPILSERDRSWPDFSEPAAA